MYSAIGQFSCLIGIGQAVWFKKGIGKLAKQIQAPMTEKIEQPHLSRLLLLAYRATVNWSLADLKALGYERITFAHTALLANISSDGASISTLADRAGITKQSMRDLAIDLEAQGYVSRSDDPVDRRATCVVLTPAGVVLLEHVRKIKDDMDNACEAMLGKQEIAVTKNALLHISERLKV